MCGIAGIVNFDTDAPVQRGELEQMALALAHRGPDGLGICIDPLAKRWGLALRRLAIIDPVGGKQPLSNEDGSCWISYNGECYNFQQLRRDLQAGGHQFKTRCDTEVVIHLYEEYGSKCVDYMRGMFAFAIWDQNKQQLFLARDRLGKKPLYYGMHNGRFIFASECKAILQIEDFPRRPDLKAIGQYLLLQYVPYPRSGFADIKQLPPGHSMTVTEENYGCPCAERYWSIPSGPTFQGSFTEACEQVRAELTEATRLRMISDVPLGAFLSGGLDSTIVVGLMSEVGTQAVKTCSIGFAEQLYNELPYARQVARRFGCDHDEHVVKANCLEGIEKLSYYYDEPFADSSALPTYYLSQLARRKVTVALTGDGGDECFGGYDRYRALQLAECVKRSRFLRWLAQRRFWDRLSSAEHHSSMHKFRRFMTGVVLPVERRYLKWLAVFDPDLLKELLTEAVTADDAGVGSQWEQLASYFDRNDEFGSIAQQHLGQAMLVDGNMYLPGDLNTKIDRAGMAVGLELRCPFQDHKVVELAYSLPVAYRCYGFKTKHILRQACADLLPVGIRRRGKMGFGVPVGRWFRCELREIFIETVLSRRALERGYFQRSTIEKLLAENDLKRQDHGHRFWLLLMLELWHRRYIDGKPSHDKPTI